MKERNNIIFSMCVKILIIISVIIGFVYGYFYGHNRGVTQLLYFTVQSNFWIAIVDLIFIVFMIRAFKHKKYQLDHRLYLVQEVFTLCITITGMIYCFVLAPAMMAVLDQLPPDVNIFSLGSVLHHIVVPVLSIFDFLMFTKTREFKKKDCFYAGIPTVYYFIFSLVGYLNKWDFGDGRNYPYFFLNYDSPAGIFGFSNEMPYFMGTFYWILIIIGLVFGLSLLYIVIINKIIRKKMNI